MLISLIGLPGVGKSTIGRRLAQRLGMALHDCDSLLEARFGRPIRTVFEVDGEARFRDAEAELLAELTAEAGADAIIATGGGVVMRPANRQLLRSRTYCVYLQARPEDLRLRLKGDAKRPLLQVADPQERLRELSVQRDPLYRDAASLVVEVRAVPFERLLSSIVSGLAAADRGAVGGVP